MEKRLRVFPLAGNAKAEVADFAGREGFTRSKRGGGEVEREMSEKGWGERDKGVKKKKKKSHPLGSVSITFPLSGFGLCGV